MKKNSTSNHNKDSNAWKFFFLLLIPLAILIQRLMSLSPEFTEKYYSRTVYKFIMQPISLLTGLVPFSVADVAIILIVIYIPIRLIFLIVNVFRTGEKRRFLTFLSNIVMVGSLWFFTQVMVWNINYERLPFPVNAGITVEDSSVDDLEDLCRFLINNTNELREQVSQDDNGIMTVEGGYKSVLNRAQQGYIALEQIYPFLEGSYGRPKPVLLSRLMSHTNIIGIYSCLTGEANVDVDIPLMDIASTALHEMAHQRGFAREDEANFLAYAACTAHPDVDFKYSGSALALQFSMNALYAEDSDRYFNLIKEYSEGYQRDLENRYAYWEQFQGITKEAASKMNDTFLKLNGQEDGVKSYGRMVDLLLAEYEHRHQK